MVGLISTRNLKNNRASISMVLEMSASFNVGSRFVQELLFISDEFPFLDGGVQPFFI